MLAAIIDLNRFLLARQNSFSFFLTITNRVTIYFLPPFLDVLLRPYTFSQIPIPLSYLCYIFYLIMFKNLLKLLLCSVISVLLVGLMQPFVMSAATTDTEYCRNCHERVAIELLGGTAHQDTDCSGCHTVVFVNETSHNTTNILCTSCHDITVEHEHSALDANTCIPCHSRGNYTFNTTRKEIILSYVIDFSN